MEALSIKPFKRHKRKHRKINSGVTIQGCRKWVTTYDNLTYVTWVNPCWNSLTMIIMLYHHQS